jgi:hypothetical protein
MVSCFDPEVFYRVVFEQFALIIVTTATTEFQFGANNTPSAAPMASPAIEATAVIV